MAGLPSPVRTSLWSYDTDRMDVARDKRRIILNVLNYGTDEAARWVFAAYPREEIAAVFENSDRSEWNRKSLNFWNAVLGTAPVNASRAERIARAQ